MKNNRGKRSCFTQSLSLPLAFSKLKTAHLDNAAFQLKAPDKDQCLTYTFGKPMTIGEGDAQKQSLSMTIISQEYAKMKLM